MTAYEMGNQYEWTQWERFGRNPADPRHIEQSTIDIIKYDKPVAGLGEKETAIIKFGRELIGQRKVSPRVLPRSSAYSAAKAPWIWFGRWRLYDRRSGADGFRSAAAGRTETAASSPIAVSRLPVGLPANGASASSAATTR